MSVKVLTLKSSAFPPFLSSIPDAPKVLYYRGDLTTLFDLPLVAVVGSRKVDSYGVHVTKTICTELARRGVVLVSGLAFGVDTLAHTSALEVGSKTIAVMPCGIATEYPRTNRGLSRQIEADGALVSEREDDYMPHEHDFLIRNRIISGLSKGVLITQAAARSGSLNTARHALEQGRTVMAVPGPITNPLCEGPNNLIKMGAVPITCADDVLSALSIDISDSSKDHELMAQNGGELLIIQLLMSGLQDGEELLQQSGLSAQEFNVHLTMLEIRGVIKPIGANLWVLA